MKWLTIKCKVLGYFCCTTVCSYTCSEMEFDALFNPFTNSMVRYKPSYENPVVVSVYDHLWSPLLVISQYITIKWYQTVLSKSGKTSVPKLRQTGKNLKPQVLHRSLPLSCEDDSIIPVSGCFSLRQVNLEQLAFPPSSPPSLGCATSQPKNVLLKSSIRIGSHAVSGTAWKESKYCILLCTTSLCCGLVFLVKDAAWF